MKVIGIICLFVLACSGDDYSASGDDYSASGDDYSASGDDYSASGDNYSASGDDYSASGDDYSASGDIAIETTQIPNHNKNKTGIGWIVFGGILGGSGIVFGLLALGRRFCRKSLKGSHVYRLKKDDNELQYDYYGIIQRRYGSDSSYA